MSEENKNKCECGCEHEDDDSIVMLEDEQGKEVAFHHVITLQHEGKDYVYLQSLEDGDDENVIEIFELETVEGETEEEGYDSLYPVDDELYEVLYAKLMKLVEEDDCDCDDEDCHCHDDDCNCAKE